MSSDMMASRTQTFKNIYCGHDDLNLKNWVVVQLYSLFLILAVVLLVNMMIALLSNTYQQVQVLNSLSAFADVY